jgi:signal transduction histidine kinase
MATNKTPTILYVDDEESNRFAFHATFEDDFDVVCAPDAATALQYLEKNEVAVIMSDQRMPVMQGDELLDQVRSRWPKIIRMMVTAYADLQLILRAVNDGLVARYVVKPWDESEVREVLRWGIQAYEMASGSIGQAVQARLLESERLATLGAIQASFLHELGTPLSYVSGSVSELALLEDFQEDLLRLIDMQPKKQEWRWRPLRQLLTDFPEVLDNLKTGSSLLSHLRDDVRKLLGSSRSSHAQRCSGGEVERAIQFALAVNKKEASLARAVLRAETPKVIPAVAIGMENLMLILINLVRNAVQALSPGKSGNEVVVRVELRNETAMAFVVSDNGEGMSESLLQSVGKQFVTTRPEGMGLGVFKCRSLAESVGGTLTYTSSPSTGTSAEVLIPLISPETSRALGGEDAPAVRN